MITWYFFEQGKEDSPQFEIKAKDQNEAYQKAYDEYGPQVDDLLYRAKVVKNDIVAEVFCSDEFKNAWSQVNYGTDASPQRTLKRLTLKVGLGYHVGSGSTFLLTEVGFLKDGKLTSKAEDFLFELCEDVSLIA